MCRMGWKECRVSGKGVVLGASRNGGDVLWYGKFVFEKNKFEGSSFNETLSCKLLKFRRGLLNYCYIQVFLKICLMEYYFGGESPV